MSTNNTKAPPVPSLPPQPPPAAGAAAAGAAIHPARPNILYIMADQLTAPLLKIHDPDSPILTPNIDALAAESVQFDSAYCPSPLCGPSRMSMMTGLLPMRIGAYDNAAEIGSEYPTFAHHLRAAGYHTALAGKMHFVGADQLHGFETRLTTDIYPADFGWAVNWDEPETRLEWYHNASSVLQAGVCVRSNELDFDEEVMYRSSQYLYDHVRKAERDGRRQPFCLTVSLTHPHDPYNIERRFWDLYDGVDIPLPKVRMAREDLDPHSRRLLRVCDLWDQHFTDDQIRRARRAYFGAVSYVDDCVGRLLAIVRDCGLDDDTVVIFAADHGDMLGERGLWYKMSFFENSCRVPLLVRDRGRFAARRVSANVSTLDLLPTLIDLAGGASSSGLAGLRSLLPMDGASLLPYLEGREIADGDTAIGEYTGEGTIQPMMMIRRGPWKFVTCPADGSQLFNLAHDPLELVDWAGKARPGGPGGGTGDQLAGEAARVLGAFEAEAASRWDFGAIKERVLLSQRMRRLVWASLREGRFESWDFNPDYDDGRQKYIRSSIPLDELERRARFPAVDAHGTELGGEKPNLESSSREVVQPEIDGI